jgi:acyl-CoA reductase-like NAD-dependent aldehyde dehydrogenase
VNNIELRRLLSREEGKTRPEGIGEVVRAGQIFKFFGGEALRLAGEKIQSIRPGVDVEVTREPLSVIGIITPWNFPVAIPAWKIAPALCYGNCVVSKPAELVPGSAWALSEIIIKAGIPTGVFNQSQAAMIMVNLPTAGVDYQVPFGGGKGSSYGPREQGRYAGEFFTVVKTAYTLP